MTKNVLIFGAGYSGAAFVAMKPANAVVAGTTRSTGRLEELRQSGMTPYLFDGLSLSPQLAAGLADVTHLVISAGPDANGDPVLGAAGQVIRTGMPNLEWIGYLSTVGVYGDHDGAWIDETSECRPVSARSRLRLATEKLWQALGKEIDLPVAVLRLSGIYGPGRNAMVKLEKGEAKRLVKANQVFNRIHVEDIAGALWHLAEAGAGGLFNVTDDEPAPPQDVVTFAAELMGIAPPPEISFETAQLSPMARSFYGENKRVLNSKIKTAGYRFRFPHYRLAYETMWREARWKRN